MKKKKKKEPLYSITDLENYAIYLRDSAASSFAEDYTENLDDFISVKQVINLIKKRSVGVDDEGNLLINSNAFDDTFDDIRVWLYGVGLAKLSAKGIIDCAWDNDINQMIFWHSENKNTIQSKPT
jgi:hypothetical protein